MKTFRTILVVCFYTFSLLASAQESQEKADSLNMQPADTQVAFIDSLRNKIVELQAEVERLETRLIFADSIVAKLSNDCLRKKYDKARVNEALADFSRMYSVELQSKLTVLKNLLENYEAYNQELVSLFTEIENDRSLSNPFKGNSQALASIERIKKTRYYREAYSKSWTIPYLNKVVDNAIGRLKGYNPKVNKDIKLIELFE